MLLITPCTQTNRNAGDKCQVQVESLVQAPLGVEQVLPFNINTDLLTDLDKTGQKVRCDSIRQGSALESRVCLHSTAQLEFLPPPTARFQILRLCQGLTQSLTCPPNKVQNKHLDSSFSFYPSVHRQESQHKILQIYNINYNIYFKNQWS